MKRGEEKISSVTNGRAILPDTLGSIRERMVKEQIQSRGIKNPRILEAMSKVPRHKFIPPEVTPHAYSDCPLPIGEGQTISQPYMVALMTELLNPQPEEKILEVGTGSGYQAAVLALLAEEVYSIERFPGLSQKAQGILEGLGYKNIKLKVDDGTRGWPEYAPFDALIITAACPHDIPEPLLDQLKEEGRGVAPIGRDFPQVLVYFRKTKGGLHKEEICGCAFVPLVGQFGWSRPT